MGVRTLAVERILVVEVAVVILVVAVVVVVISVAVVVVTKGVMMVGVEVMVAVVIIMVLTMVVSQTGKKCNPQLPLPPAAMEAFHWSAANISTSQSWPSEQPICPLIYRINWSL